MSGTLGKCTNAKCKIEVLNVRLSLRENVFQELEQTNQPDRLDSIHNEIIRIGLK